MIPIPTDVVAQTAALPFAIVERLGVPCGYERSFKMQREKLLANRYMLGVSTADLTQEQLLKICHQMDMPKAYLDSFAANVAEANLVFLGFEHDDSRCLYKIYLEYWDKLNREIRNKSNPQEPILLHLGYKWDTTDRSRATIAKYTCHPLLSVQDILKRIAKIYGTGRDDTSLPIIEDIIELALSKNRAISPIYLEAAEENNPRISFDINLYKATLRLSQLRPMLSRMHRHFAFSSEEFGKLYNLVCNKLLGHLSGGVDRNGNDFLTVYYEV